MPYNLSKGIQRYLVGNVMQWYKLLICTEFIYISQSLLFQSPRTAACKQLRVDDIAKNT